VDEAARAKLEGRVRDLCSAGDYDGAAVLRGYGAEIFGFLVAFHSSEDEANEAFCELAEVVWRGLPQFGWDSTVRTWAYAVAHNVSRTRSRDRIRRERRLVDASEPMLQEIAQKVRSETMSFLRTEKKTRLQALRDALPEQDRMLLVLRVDRGLSWNELARVFSERDGPGSPDDATITTEAARLRKRFQLVKERLREQAKREGLIE
jgi:RNA polymerase sigma-70 factor (ECF subfamily)